MRETETVSATEADREAAAHREFARVWVALSRRGKCDSWGSAECRRVHREWVEAGRPTPPAPFICRRANVRADGAEPAAR